MQSLRYRTLKMAHSLTLHRNIALGREIWPQTHHLKDAASQESTCLYITSSIYKILKILALYPKCLLRYGI